MAICRLSITVSGKVQGVFFRKYTREKALELAITGTVQNRQNGVVFILAEGEKPNMDAFVAWCHLGSPASVVERVDTAEIQGSFSFQGFTITY
jgi:acylphosphatase